ncbi:MAG: hypothetical protein IT204_07405 [Fimbriimonadaceae bacterium]|nr:hypothetical protein [Fimbriimonadaceae bacterium]
MSQRILIVVHKVRTPHRLMWTANANKWRVEATNRTARPLYLSWGEILTNPFTNALWIARIDEGETAGDRYIAEPTNLVCTSFVTTGSDEHRIAPDRFVQIAIAPGATASWLMERVAKSIWDGFNIYEQCLAEQIRAGQVPVAVENIEPRI